VSILRYLKPSFLYANRRLIPVYLRSYWRDARRGAVEATHRTRALLARHGVGLTGNERRLAALRDKHVGRRAFVVGTGPSLRISDLERLQNEITLASNQIYVCFGETKWRPTYYANWYLNDADIEYPRIDGIERCVKFLPVAAMKGYPSVRNAIYVRHVQRNYYPGLPEFSYDALCHIFWGGTVTYLLLQLAWFLGLREVYLLGVNFDYKIKEENKSDSGINPQWYSTDRDPDHFHPSYLPPGARAGLTSLHLHEASYRAAKQAFEAHGGRIWNATRGGKLEIFPRVDLDEIIPPAPKP